MSIAAAQAQSSPAAETPSTTGSLPDTRESVAKHAIRVPAFGTTQPTTMTLASAKPRKRPRIDGRAVETPPPAYWRPLHYRFGYGYGPGLRLYRW